MGDAGDSGWLHRSYTPEEQIRTLEESLGLYDAPLLGIDLMK